MDSWDTKTADEHGLKAVKNCNFTDSEEDSRAGSPDVFSSDNEELGKGRDEMLPGIVHALSPKWVFWLWVGEREKAWGDCLKQQCVVKSIEDFFALKHRILPPSRLPNDYLKYLFFKEGIKPVWEDPCNRRGGSIDIVIPNNQQHTLLDRLWFELLMTTMGGQFGNSNSLICGVILNLRKHNYAISLWIRSSAEPKGDLINILEAKLGVATQKNVQMSINKHQMADGEDGGGRVQVRMATRSNKM